MNRARWTVQYHQRVLASDPFAYWIEDEKQGVIAYDRVSGRALGAQNGAHVGVTLGQPGIGDGRTSPFYDGANDYTNVQTAAFSAAFSAAEGSILVWVQVSAAGVWTDGVFRTIYRLEVDGNNYVHLLKTNNNNELRFRLRAGGVNNNIIAAWSDAGWFSSALTWNKAANQVIAYLNGGNVGAVVYNGVWAGVFALSLIGAQSLVPANLWSGNIAHVAVWDRMLPPAEIAGLGVIE